MTPQERRRFFRIDDQVRLSYRPADQAPNAAVPVDDAVNLQVSAARLLDGIDKQLDEAIDVMWKNNPTLANVVSLLNKKMDVLATEINLKYNPADLMGAEFAAVNISACGIAFECSDRYMPGELLHLDLFLQPSGTHLQLKGRVVVCEASSLDSVKPYTLRLNFEQVNNSTEEELIQHVVQRQSFLLAQQRVQQTPDSSLPDDTSDDEAF